MTDEISGAQDVPEAERVLREELEKAASLAAGARRLMAEGRSVDLSALEERVRTIAQAARTAPPEVARAYKEHLEVLVEIFDALETDMESRRKALEDGLKAIRTREAQGAYAPKDKP